MTTVMVAPSPAVADTQEQAALGGPELDDALSILIPKPLSDRDAELYEQIFAVQEQGRWKDADRLISRLSDDVLMGHVLAQRYLHPTAYRSRYKELKDWLASYADLPQAPRIYKLALTRRGSASYPKKPVGSYVSGAGHDYEDISPYYHKSTKKLSAPQRSRLRRLKVVSATGLAVDGRPGRFRFSKVRKQNACLMPMSRIRHAHRLHRDITISASLTWR